MLLLDSASFRLRCSVQQIYLLLPQSTALIKDFVGGRERVNDTQIRGCTARPDPVLCGWKSSTVLACVCRASKGKVIVVI